MAFPQLGRRRSPTQDFEELRKRAADARLPFDKDMLLNLAFFLDHQYTEWVAAGAFIRTIPRKERMQNQPRPVANKIMHFVQQEHAYALANKPMPDVLPASDDPIDISMTMPALAYLNWLSEPQVGDFENELSDATWWALICGEGYIKWYFDPQENRPAFMSCSPLDILLDPYATKFKHARYFIHSRFMDVEQVEAIYGKKVKPSTVSRADQAKAALLREMGHAPVLEGAQVNELWLRPGVHAKYPNGLFVVWAGNEFLVEPRDFPYKHKRMPLTQIGCIPRPGSPHYTSAVKYLRSAQMELNKYHAQRIMVRERFANPKWWLPTELELEHDPDDSPAQILRGNSQQGTIKPEIIQPTTFPENSDGDWIVSEMQDIVGLHEVSQAQVPGRVEAAKAIELLKEADVSRLNELERTIKLAVSEGFWQCLMLAKQYTPAEQIVQTYSREGLPEVRRFKAELLKPGIRVRVTMGTGLARSRAAKADLAMTLWREGIIQDPEVMSELMDVPVGTIAPQRAFDIRLARNENLRMAAGTDPDGKPGTAIKPNSWDAHDIHLREHNNFRKTEEYEELDPEIKRKFEFHCQTHEDMLLQQLAKEAERQIVASGQGLVPDEGGEAAGAPPPDEGAGMSSAPQEMPSEEQDVPEDTIVAGAAGRES